MLTIDAATLRSRIDAARRREREARAEASRLRREMSALNRRRETQRLCVLGRAWESWAERTPGFADQAARYLSGYVSRDTDREALRGTRWQLPELPAHDEVLAEGGDGVGA